MKFISFVVDVNFLHYYQAQLLLHSLTLNTNFSKENIIVQCIEGVHQEFIDYLEKEGFKYHYISPFLDKKYCNKLQQLEYFISNDLDVESVILMDADMYVLDNAIYELDSEHIIGKVVDAPNPPLDMVKGIFNESCILLPELVDSDWQIPNNQTIKGNFNGGFYYIPAKHIKNFNSYWQKWATWLFERPYLFTDPKYIMHIDQLSFAMALQDSAIPCNLLKTNYNFPLHSKHKSNYLDDKTLVHIVHYHRQLDDFGFIDTSKISINTVKEFIEKVNLQISQLEESLFYMLYKKSLLPSIQSFIIPSIKDKFIRLFNEHSSIKVYIHAGTPKTATTTFQFACIENSKYLIEKNILYPTNYTQNGVPKHQWLVQLMLNGDIEGLYQKFVDIFNEAVDSECVNIVLSTEGIYNHWWDFPDNSKEVWSILSRYIETKLIITFRDPVSFLYSFYQQNLKNPRVSIAKCYGQNWSLEEMLQDKWFVKHLDYLSFINEVENIFGKDAIVLLKYDKGILKKLFNIVDIDLENIKLKSSHNKGLSTIAIELLKTLNRFNIKAHDKQLIIQQMMDCDEVLKQYQIPKEELSEKIMQIFALQKKVFDKYKDLQFDNLFI